MFLCLQIMSCTVQVRTSTIYVRVITLGTFHIHPPFPTPGIFALIEYRLEKRPQIDKFYPEQLIEEFNFLETRIAQRHANHLKWSFLVIGAQKYYSPLRESQISDPSVSVSLSSSSSILLSSSSSSLWLSRPSSSSSSPGIPFHSR